MKQIKPLSKEAEEENKADTKDAEQYHLVELKDGTLHCSCGSILIQMDETTYRCEGGYPTYSLANGEVMYDKFGNLMLKTKPHAESNTDV